MKIPEFQKLSRLTLCLLITLLSILIVYCDEDSPLVPDETPVIEFLSVDFPDTVWTGAVYSFTVRAATSVINDIEVPPSGIVGLLEMEDLTSELDHFTLLDNGVNPDNIPGDFEFTASVSNQIFEGNTGQAEITLSIIHAFTKKALSPTLPYLTGDPYIDTVIVLSGVENNTPPELLNLTVSDTIIINDATQTFFSVDVLDGQGQDDIAEVIAELYFPQQTTPGIQVLPADNGLDPDILAGDGTYSGYIPHNPIASYGQGAYSLLVYAKDSAGNKSNNLMKEITVIDNRGDFSPEIVNIIAPDSIKAGGSLQLLQVEAADQNGINDINRVYFITTKPDGTSSGIRYDMYDDGGQISVTSGDITAGDSIYSLTIQIPSGTNLGRYKFTFYVTDKSQNIVTQEHYIEIY